MMLKEGIGGFCMALADSVPGVSGGTVAFIMGFYDRFIGSIHDFVFGNMDKKKEALKFLVKLGIGWLAGMILAGSTLFGLSGKTDDRSFSVSCQLVCSKVFYFQKK